MLAHSNFALFDLEHLSGSPNKCRRSNLFACELARTLTSGHVPELCSAYWFASIKLVRTDVDSVEGIK